jgi:hypothetical protein
MSHAYSFFLFSVGLFLTPKVIATDKYRWWILFGLTIGLIVLIRPTNLLFILVPLLYGCYSLKDIVNRTAHFIQKFRQVFVSLLLAITVFIPQLVYWHHISGSWIYYSYGNEHFIFWQSPKIIEVLFSVQNGWLLYSPIMITAIAGLYFSAKQRHPLFLPTIIILPMATYIFASWWAWWFGAAFGHRSYIEFTSMLLFPMLYFIQWLNRKSFPLFTLGWVCLTLLTYYSVKMSYLYTPPWDGPTWNWSRYVEQLNHLF